MNGQIAPDEIYLARDGERTGPYRMAEVRELARRGVYAASGLAWYPGAPQWTPLRNVSGFVMGAVPPPVPHAYAARTWQEEVAPRYAGFWIRVAASIIDSVVLFIPMKLIENVSAAAPAGDASSPVTSWLIAIVAWWAYRSALHSSPWQATVGKLAVGVQVTDAQGQRISFGRATRRYLAEFLSALTLCLGCVMAGFTERKQALHDLLADTLVVYR